MPQTDANMINLIKRAVELTRPNMRDYYRMVRKARVVKTYASDGQYWCDVQPLLNNDSDDTREPVVTQVEIPIMWGGPLRGVVCPPEVGTLCDLSYYDGDPAYPRVSNFRWQGNQAPECETGALIIQKEPGVSIKIDAEKNIIHVTPENRRNEIGQDKQETVGGEWTIQVTGEATIVSGDTINLQAPLIAIQGNLSVGGASGCSLADTCYDWDHEGDIRQVGDHHLDGDIHVNTLYYKSLVAAGDD